MLSTPHVETSAPNKEEPVVGEEESKGQLRKSKRKKKSKAGKGAKQQAQALQQNKGQNEKEVSAS